MSHTELVTMAEISNQRGLIPISGVDFTLPWFQIVPQINLQLEAQRYLPFGADEVTKDVLIADYSSPRPRIHEGKSGFDPVRVDEDPLNERYTPKEKAIALLGLQAAYWDGLWRYVDPFQPFIPGNKLADYEGFSCVPVIRLREGTYLIGMGNKISEIQYAGDSDMISCAKSRELTRDGVTVPFLSLGVDDETLDEYIAFRAQLTQADSEAVQYAFSRLQNQPEVWAMLLAVFPNIAMLVKSAPSSGYFVSEAKNLVKDIFLERMRVGSEALDPEVHVLIQHMGEGLRNYLWRKTRYDYGKHLRDNPSFIGSIRGLHEITSLMYLVAFED
jgi:hypothetical protein